MSRARRLAPVLLLVSSAALAPGACALDELEDPEYMENSGATDGARFDEDFEFPEVEPTGANHDETALAGRVPEIPNEEDLDLWHEEPRDGDCDMDGSRYLGSGPISPAHNVHATTLVLEEVTGSTTYTLEIAKGYRTFHLFEACVDGERFDRYYRADSLHNCRATLRDDDVIVDERFLAAWVAPKDGGVAMCDPFKS